MAAILSVLGCATTAQPGQVTYELSSRDLVDWHLHARDGRLVCVLPCEASIGEQSGDYLVVHDPKKAWRVDIPSELPAAAGGRVTMEPRVGKGHPALGAFGMGVAVTGATIAATGVGLLLAGIATIQLCPTGSTCNSDPTVNLILSGSIVAAVGLVLGSAGFVLTERNKPAAVTIRVLPGSIAGTF